MRVIKMTVGRLYNAPGKISFRTLHLNKLRSRKGEL